MVDFGAPQVSLAEAEFAALATLWQEQSRKASEQAMYFMALSCSMGEVYNDMIARAIKLKD